MKKAKDRWVELLRQNLREQIWQAIRLGYASPEEIHEVVREHEECMSVQCTDYEGIKKG